MVWRLSQRAHSGITWGDGGALRNCSSSHICTFHESPLLFFAVTLTTGCWVLTPRLRCSLGSFTLCFACRCFHSKASLANGLTDPKPRCRWCAGDPVGTEKALRAEWRALGLNLIYLSYSYSCFLFSSAVCKVLRMHPHHCCTLPECNAAKKWSDDQASLPRPGNCCFNSMKTCSSEDV